MAPQKMPPASAANRTILPDDHPRNVQAIIFDMDGVLVDSEHVITKAAMLALKEYGVTVKESDFHPFTGTGEDRFIGGVAALYGLDYKLEMKTRTYQIYLDIVREEIRIFDGISELLRLLRAHGLKTAVASSADRIKVNANLPAAGIDPLLFDAICSGDDVVHKKPAPDIFLLAASRLGIPPKNCIVIEDAVSGITAATAAGMRSIGVTSAFPAERLIAAGAIAAVPETPAIAGVLL